MSSLSESRETVTAASPLTGRLIARAEAGADLRRAMFALLAQHFGGVDRDVFASDLAEKNWIILLEDRDGRLRGFSTLLVTPMTVAGRSRILIYSGDTIVDRSAWGTRTLPQMWIGSVLTLSARYTQSPQSSSPLSLSAQSSPVSSSAALPASSGDAEVYWLLLTSGFRTYRFLPVFFRWFHPRAIEPVSDPANAADAMHDSHGARDSATPADPQALLDAFAHARFGDRYDAATGIVRLTRPQVLHADLLGVPEGRRADPHVAFFLARNPGYVRGDELACLTRIAGDNLTPAGRRMVRGYQDAR